MASQGLQQNSQDTSAFYLAHIYQVTAAGGSTSPVLPLPPNLSDPFTFTPSSSVICVNVLWFMSLIISLTCALLATLLQQWARRYLRLTETQYSLHKRARIRAFFAEGLEKWSFPWVVEALPGLLHLSVFLFFAGLPIFLFGINQTVFTAVLSCVGTSGLSYLLVTFMPLVFHDSPYHTPLSTLAWLLNAAIQSALLLCLQEFVLLFFLQAHAVSQSPNRILSLACRMLHRVSSLVETQLIRLRGGQINEMQSSAQRSSWQIDTRALSWTFSFQDDEHDLEQVLAAIPGFYKSSLVNDSQKILSAASERISGAVLQLMDRSLSSDLLDETVRKQRSAMCSKILEILPDLRHATTQQSLRFIGTGIFEWIELGLLVHQDDNFNSKCVAALVTVHTRGSDECWSSTIMHQLGISKSVFQVFLDEGDSLLFLNLLDFIRWLVFHCDTIPRSDFETAANVLNTLRKFDVVGTLPELRHQFCSIWNALLYVQMQLEPDDPLDPFTVRNLRDIIQMIRPLAWESYAPFPWLWGRSLSAQFFRVGMSRVSPRSLTRLLLNRLVTVYNSLHPGPDGAAATIQEVSDTWDEYRPVELSYPRCNDPSHGYTDSPNPHAVDPSNAVDTVTDLHGVSQGGTLSSTPQALSAVYSAFAQLPPSPALSTQSLQQVFPPSTSPVTTANSPPVSVDATSPLATSSSSSSPAAPISSPDSSKSSKTILRPSVTSSVP